MAETRDVQRYIFSDKSGAFVKAEDYDTLQARAEALEQALAKLIADLEMAKSWIDIRAIRAALAATPEPRGHAENCHIGRDAECDCHLRKS